MKNTYCLYTTDCAGISLLETMIVIAIIGIITAWSYPSYTQHIRRVECHRARVALQQAANRIEHYASTHGNYIGATRQNLNFKQLEHDLHYEIKINQIKPFYFMISAVSTDQKALSDCRAIQLDSTQSH